MVERTGAIDRQSDKYQDLIHRAYRAMFEQSERFRTALMQTRGMLLAHSTGENNPYKTILTPTELCGILTELRDNYDKRDKTQELIEKSVTYEHEDLEQEKPTKKKIVYVDMGGVLFLGKVFAEWRSALPESVLENGCFFLAVWFFFWGWIQYLILDGARFFSLMKTRKEELTDEFTDGERAIIRLCSDIVTGIIFLIVYGVLCYIG